MKQIGAFGVALLIATVMPATAAATFTQTVHQDIPLAAALTSCSGEPVVVQGSVSLDMHVTINDDGSFQTYESARAQGTGTGTVSGVSYLSDDYSFSSATVALPREQVTQTHRWLFTATGDSLGTPVLGDDFYLYAQFHITVNASGLPAALIDNLTVTCR
jgi:hypothetical protein